MFGGKPQARLIGNIDVGEGGVLEGWAALQDGDQILGSRRVQFLVGAQLVGETTARLPRSDIPRRGGRTDFGFRVNCSDSQAGPGEASTVSIVDVETGARLDTLFELVSNESLLLLDVGDTLIYLSHHSTVSGIQRVVIELYLAMTQELGVDVGLVAGHEEGLGVFRVPASEWDRLLKALHENPERVPTIASAIRSEAFSSDPVRVGPEAVLLVFGSPWVSENYIESILRCRVRGARVVSLVYDLIPSRLPAMFDLPTKKRFERVLAAYAAISDAVMAISRFTGEEFSSFCREQGLQQHQPTPIRLASSLHKSAGRTPSAHDGIDGTTKPYVMLVSTVEGRKGHSLALDVWERLIRDLGSEKTPRLVFVGRPGWNSQSTFERLSATNYLGGLVSLKSNVSDAQLATLYDRALFTIYPSTYEGWGLPVGESLGFGTPVIAAENTSIPEVGGDAVQYFPTGDAEALYQQTRAWIEDNELRAQWVERARNWREDTWLEVAERAWNVVESLVQSDGAPASRVRTHSRLAMRPREEVTFGYARTALEASDLMSLSWEIDVLNASPIMGYPHSTVQEVRGSLILRGSLYSPEQQGRWSRREAPLGLSFTVDPSRSWSLMLLVSSGSADTEAFLRVSGDCKSANYWAKAQRVISLELKPEPDGSVDIDIEVQRRGVLDDANRTLGAYLRSALLIATDDFVGHSHLLVALTRTGGFLEGLNSWAP